MIQKCEQCGTPIQNGQSNCPVCAKPKVGDGNGTISADQTAIQKLAARRQTLTRVFGIGLIVIVVIAVGSVVGYKAWMAGRGGEIACERLASLALEASQREQYATADAYYAEMIALRPDRATTYMLRGINNAHANLFPQSIRDNTAGLEHTNVPLIRAALYQNRAHSYAIRLKWQQDIEDLNHAEKEYNRTLQMIAQHAKDEGRAVLSDDLGRVPEDLADVRRARAHANMELHEYKAALLDYNTNIQNNMGKAEDYGNRATIENESGQDAEAVADYGRALCKDTSYLYALQNMMPIVKKNHTFEQAVAALKPVLQVEPDNVLILGTLGSVSYEIHDYRGAIAYEQRALNLDPNQAWIVYSQAIAYAMLNDTAHATPKFAQALALGSDRDLNTGLIVLQEEIGKHPNIPALKLALSQLQHGGSALPPHSSATPAKGGSLDAQLDGELKLEYFRIRPPKGYTQTRQELKNLSGTEMVYGWEGPKRSDGTAPYLEVRVSIDSGQTAAFGNATERLTAWMENIESRHTNYKGSAISKVYFDTRTFATASWTGGSSRTGKDMTGTELMSVRGGEVIAIRCNDATVYSSSTLPLLMASIHTFRR